MYRVCGLVLGSFRVFEFNVHLSILGKGWVFLATHAGRFARVPFTYSEPSSPKNNGSLAFREPMRPKHFAPKP